MIGPRVGVLARPAAALRTIGIGAGIAHDATDGARRTAHGARRTYGAVASDML